VCQWFDLSVAVFIGSFFFDMSDPKTAKCEYCSCRYPYKKMGPAYDTVNDRFFTTQCGTCPNIMCYSCKFELEDPFDMCTFEVDTCVTCNSKFRTTAKKRNNICINFFLLNHSGKCCELANQHWRKWKAKENFSKNELVEEIDHESFFEWDEKLPESWSD